MTREPFEYFIVPGFVRAQAREKSTPTIRNLRGRQLSRGPAFLWPGVREFLDELESDEFRDVFEEKFGVDLAGRPSTITVRGQCSLKDGRIHTDTKSKIITILIYMNPAGRTPAAACAS